MQFSCPQCGKQYQAEESFAGRTANCKACGESFRVPTLGSDDIPDA